MDVELFGTDGIRGPVGQYPIDKKGAEQIGKTVGAYFSKGNKLIIVAHDPRESSPWLEESLVKGLADAGAHVERLGVITTPGLAYLTKNRGAAAGVMVTASHNPYTDNGIKVFTADGRKLTDDSQVEMSKLAISEIPDQSSGSISNESQAKDSYTEFLVEAAEGADLKGLKIGLDSANGAASGLAKVVFEKLGAEVVSMFDQPDGKNINVKCGATDTTALQETVVDQKLDLGIAFDGDADRVVLVDGKGRLLNGDQMLFILAVSGKHKAIVATSMSNMGLENGLKKHGIAMHRTGVGDRQVLAELEKQGLTLGGEQSGHIVLTDYLPTGDGMLAAIVVLREVRRSGKTLAEWYDAMPLMPQSLVNIPLADKSLLTHSEVQEYISQAEAQLAGQGRLNIRPSGTEPKLRIMVEANDADTRAEAIAKDLSQILEAIKK